MNINTFKKSLDQINYEHFVFLKVTEALRLGSAPFDLEVKIEKDGSYVTPEIIFVDGVGYGET